MSEDQSSLHDSDPLETKEWLDALDSLLSFEGPQRAQFILNQLATYSNQKGLGAQSSINTPYINSLTPEQSANMPDDGQMTERLTNILRWNAIVMVMRAGKKASELGGHIASFGSIATLFEVGFQYFFHAANAEHGGDLVYFQGHSSPGIYARAFLEGRLNENQLDHFRQEITGDGLSSYPHPWLMPDFWQLPTVSMGLGPLMAIYQARFLRYLDHRGLVKTSNRKVWAFCGDGEMGEPESLGALNLAGREKLDNLIFVINCNLQRLDGPVWGNGQIIQEYEGVYRGAGWNVIKVIWGAGWDALFQKDTDGWLQRRVAELVDGEYQKFSAGDVTYLREHFFGKYPELSKLVEDMSDEELSQLQDGGHDISKVYAAYAAATIYKGKPTVILAKTIKGYGMGGSGEAQNITHQTKKMKPEDLQACCERFSLPLNKDQIEQLAYFKPTDDSPEMKYLHAQREKLGGYLPKRSVESLSLEVPALSAFEAQLQGTGDREVSTTMAFVRILSTLLRDKTLKDRIVPIVADESRTFGMEGLFRQIGIYAPFGQQYEPEDKKLLMYYREDQKGQLLQEGISEAGAMSSWIAAATTYANSACPMIPFYIYYSMFGFQRFGDLAWAAGDMRARGFILGATAGRTTLAGEGLQHQDGHNIIMFSAIPNCVTYDPCFAFELAVIIQDGLRRMYQNEEDVYYYIALMNENYQHPSIPENVTDDILKGLYCLQDHGKKADLQLMGAGTILREVIKAADILSNDFGVVANVWSATSFNECRKDIERTERYNRLHADLPRQQSHVEKCFAKRKGPVVAASDYMKMYAEQIRGAIPNRYVVLGTDGYGRSDTRVALREFFEVDAKMIAYTSLKALCDEGKFKLKALKKAAIQLGISGDKPDPISQ